MNIPTIDPASPVHKGDLMPVSPDEIMDFQLKSISAIPVPAGKHYVRVAVLTTKVVGGGSSQMGAMTVHQPIDAENIILYGDIKLALPEKAKAVYIGTIVYHHNGKETTNITIKDDFNQAMQELNAKHIKGFKPNEVVKHLAMITKSP